MALRACMFTNAPDEHFILDLHPEDSRVVVASPCSGHGFKFCSVVGEIVADLAETGETRHDIGLFRLGRFAEGDRDAADQAVGFSRKPAAWRWPPPPSFVGDLAHVEVRARPQRPAPPALRVLEPGAHERRFRETDQHRLADVRPVGRRVHDRHPVAADLAHPRKPDDRLDGLVAEAQDRRALARQVATSRLLQTSKSIGYEASAAVTSRLFGSSKRQRSRSWT